MSRIGYIFQSKALEKKEEALSWMKDFGCDIIILEEGIQEKLRPEWRKMLSKLEKHDTIVINKT